MKLETPTLLAAAAGTCFVGSVAVVISSHRTRQRGPKRLLREPAANCDESLTRRAIEVSTRAVQRGNHPFGALLYDRKAGLVLAEAENTVETDRDVTAHAELNLVRFASQQGIDMNALTLFTSTEPCPMCAGAMYWAGIKDVVFACSEEGLYKITLGVDPKGPALHLPCMDVFAKGAGSPVMVSGPLLENEAVEIHKGFWPAFLAQFLPLVSSTPCSTK